MNNVKKKINEIKKIVSEKGMYRSLMIITRKIFKKVFYVKNSYIYELDIMNGDTKISPEIELKYSIATENEIRRLDEKKYGYDERGKKYSINGIKNGDICIFAFWSGKLIGYISHMKEKMELSEGNLIELPKWRSYLYKGLVIEEFRGKRVLAGLINYQIKILKDLGKNSLVYTVSKNNLASNRATERMGFKRIGNIIQIKLFGLKYDYISKNNLNYLKERNYKNII